MRITSSASLICLLLAGCGVGTLDATDEELLSTELDALSVQITPVADAEVSAANPYRNYGGTTSLTADGDPKLRSYIRFKVGTQSAPIQSAIFRCYTGNGSTNGPALYEANGSWGEKTITWSNQPGFKTPALGNKGAVDPWTWISFDVSSVVTGPGTYDFVLAPTSTDSVICRSREYGSHPPQLILKLADTVPTTPTTPDAGTSTPTVDAGTSTPDAGPTPSLPGWKLYWSDEFNATTLNTSVWKPYHNTYGDGNNELPCLTPNNVSVSGGALHIVARRQTVTCPNGSTRQFTSGFLGTRENGVYFPRYGRYEIRAKLPHMNALWPAFWLRHRDGASVVEVDIMEYFHAQVPGKTTATLHYNGQYNYAKGGKFFEAPTLTPGWHTWAVEMEPVDGKVCFKYFVDGSMVTFNGLSAGQPKCFTDVGPFGRYPGQNLFDIAVNMAVGGNWVGHPDGPLDRLMNGTRVDPTNVKPTTFPTEYVVDYVRVYTR